MSSMMRLVSLSARAVTRSDSRKTAANGQHAITAASSLPAVAVPILSSAALDKLAAACRRHHSTHAATRVVSPVASPKLMSPVVSQAPSSRMTPVQSRAPSRRNSLSCGACGVGVRVGGGSRIIAPFMPSSFSSRGIHARGGGGGTHPEQQHQHTGEHVRVKEKEHQQQHQRQGTIPVVLTPQQAAEEMARSQGRTAGARPVINVVITEDGESAASRVIKNSGLSDFLTRIYRTTGLSVGLTLLGSWGLSLVLPPAMFMPSLVGGLVVSLGSMFAMFKSTPPTMLVPGQPGNKLTTVNTPGRQAAFATFVAANAFMLTPLVAMCNALHPLIVPVSAVGAGLVMAGASYVAFKRPSGSLLSLTGPLVGALGGAIVLQLAGVASLYFIGPNLFSSVVYSVYPYVGLGLFSVFTAVDTHTAIAEYESGKADHLMHSVSFYLNFVNLFASIARIISDMLRE